ncbi:MAG: hypothetical protein DWQ08_14770 [Proteobacteria bacterium]|nr:MAG: hypothetical protein DWQ08_14770 [Pseudomonadota bacterium]
MVPARPVLQMKRASLILLAAALALTGCASQPLVDRGAVDLEASPEQAAAKETAAGTVNWGGRIIALRSVGETTEFEILSYPLGSGGRPDTGGASDGRFIAVRDGFVDPLIYDEGRVVTLIGRIESFRDGTVGEQSYRWPVVKVLEIAPAPEPRRQRVTPFFSIGVGIGL